MIAINNGNNGTLRQWGINSEYGREKEVMRCIADAFSKEHLAFSRLDDMLTAVSEACLNAIEHGNGVNSGHVVRVAMITKTEGIIFRICDEGPGFDALPFTKKREQNFHAANPRGWGLYLMSSLADEVKLVRERGQFCVELYFNVQ